jgi:hypothetical protein
MGHRKLMVTDAPPGTSGKEKDGMLGKRQRKPAFRVVSIRSPFEGVHQLSLQCERRFVHTPAQSTRSLPLAAARGPSMPPNGRKHARTISSRDTGKQRRHTDAALRGPTASREMSHAAAAKQRCAAVALSISN